MIKQFRRAIPLQPPILPFGTSGVALAGVAHEMFGNLTPSELTEKVTALKPLVATAVRSVMHDTKHLGPILQDVRVAILAATPPLSFQHEQQFKSWLWLTATNLSLTRYRKYRRDNDFQDPDLLQENNCNKPEKAVEDSDLCEHFLSLLDTAEQNHLLLWVHHQSHQEVAEILGIKPEACRQRYRRIIKKLRQHIDDLNL
jgi:RNA polymerase sigma factor (sigma-70 family)